MLEKLIFYAIKCPFLVRGFNFVLGKSLFGYGIGHQQRQKLNKPNSIHFPELSEKYTVILYSKLKHADGVQLHRFEYFMNLLLTQRRKSGSILTFDILNVLCLLANRVDRIMFTFHIRSAFYFFCRKMRIIDDRICQCNKHIQQLRFKNIFYIVGISQAKFANEPKKPKYFDRNVNKLNFYVKSFGSWI